MQYKIVTCNHFKLPFTVKRIYSIIDLTTLPRPKRSLKVLIARDKGHVTFLKEFLKSLPFPLDEIIRQVTINCAERGLLLLQVRDEIRMTIAAYQTLYKSSVGFGMRKALQAEEGKTDMEQKVSTATCCLKPTLLHDSFISI